MNQEGRRRKPRSGCGAAILRDGALYLLKRVKQPEAGHWGLPGGKVDWGEPVGAAIEREVAEELGIGVRSKRLLCVVDLIDRGDGEHWISPVYLVTAFEGEPENREPAKHAGVGWFALDALPAPLTTATVEALRALGLAR
ncbi:NUDIX hydrolase [Prosthecomicrobium sp. N25]|uniref:NUDIX hydrolase n=1 Tax=Prosthecomicrobium sp. N25 TaxID=3129254 RepID=UPI0030775266